MGMAVSVLLISVLGIFAIMPDAPFVDVLYELTSAIGTVGLSRGLTAVLNTPAKWIVIFTMYLGRIGPLTLGAAVVSRAQKRTKDVHLAEENIMIG
ncbi:potassium transporter TrkG [Ruminococcus sp. AM42-11]|uniref:potassium transporter TrkG n=1 Tax=Ruminococcus sp. AM42-11 TaxID=2292372 RepID=UPI00242DEC71|nr:potassium transporter TrkG [Ruminococcus sp. AM42-11]